MVEAGGAAGLVKLSERPREVNNIREGEIMPFAPVGGWMCAASPARNSRPNCIGSTTKLRIGVTPFCTILPCGSAQEPPSRLCNSSQIFSSGHSARSSSGAHCRYSRESVGEHMEKSAKPRS